MQYSVACDFKTCTNNIFILPVLTEHNVCSKNQHDIIHAESDKVEISYPKKIQLQGNIYVKYHNHSITSDILTIENNKQSHTIIYAKGNVHYYNKDITLIGSHAQLNLNNKNIDLYQGTYHLHKSQFYGTAELIMQRKNNRYTIMKKSNFTNCKICNNYWGIMGSMMLYDWNKNNIHIWNAFIRLKKTPIFYIPYLSFSINQNNILKSYIPTIGYNNKYGFILNAPFPLIFSKHYSGKIIPYYISNFGNGLKTKINYFIKPSIGLITIDIIQHNTENYNNQIYYTLYWKHHGIINNNWNLDIDYIIHSHPTCHHFKNLKKKYPKSIDNRINQKFLFYHQNKFWKTSILYLSSTKTYEANNIQNHCIYSASPQLEIQFRSNPFWKKKLHCQILHQLSQFIPSNYFYPESVRIHMEPIMYFTTYNNWGKFNIDLRLKITHYQQNNINTYNMNQYEQHYLKNKINRIIPQFKINGAKIFYNKTNIIKPYKYFLESKLQYLYIPYVFQENIGIYDTKIIYTDYNNLFYGIKYSGLDRIQSINQIINNITIHYFHKESELFNISIGQIANLDYNNIFLKNNKHKKYDFDKQIINTNSKFILLGTGYWNINNYWNIRSELQYDNLFHKLSYGNAILEYVGKKNKILQIKYRYINKKYFQKNLMPSNNSIYSKTIYQFGINTYFPIKNNWILNYSYHYNIKSNSLINQTISIQYSTPCYIFGINFEKSIIDWNKRLHMPSYDNKIQLNFKLINFNKNHNQT